MSADRRSSAIPAFASRDMYEWLVFQPLRSTYAEYVPRQPAMTVTMQVSGQFSCPMVRRGSIAPSG